MSSFITFAASHHVQRHTVYIPDTCCTVTPATNAHCLQALNQTNEKHRAVLCLRWLLVSLSFETYLLTASCCVMSTPVACVLAVAAKQNAVCTWCLHLSLMAGCCNKTAHSQHVWPKCSTQYCSRQSVLCMSFLHLMSRTE